MYNMAVQGQQLAVSEATRWSTKNRETDLQQWWVSQSEAHPDLVCQDGERLVVIDPGQPNDGPGPDIMNCHLLMDDVEFAGPVEIHTDSSHWFAHGHHEDPAYEPVILHVVFHHDRGPDIPTLCIPEKWVVPFSCLASRPVQMREIQLLGVQRFVSKYDHLNHLGASSTNYHPLMLGMMEVILAGPERDQHLQELAVFLKLSNWPDQRPWLGSRRSFGMKRGISKQKIQYLIQQDDLFIEWEKMPLEAFQSWPELDRYYPAFRQIGISKSQYREWLINILIPGLGPERGVRIWKSLPPFRHYGHERRYLHRIGLQKVASILQQQGLLAWRNRYCKPRHCQSCPLLQSHHDLTQVN